METFDKHGKRVEEEEDKDIIIHTQKWNLSLKESKACRCLSLTTTHIKRAKKLFTFIIRTTPIRKEEESNNIL